LPLDEVRELIEAGFGAARAGRAWRSWSVGRSSSYFASKPCVGFATPPHDDVAIH
jgi:hypothetical protein